MALWGKKTNPGQRGEVKGSHPVTVMLFNTSCTTASSTYLYKQWVRLIVDSVRVVELAIVPQDLAHRRVLLGHCEHPPWIAALCQQLPVQGV